MNLTQHDLRRVAVVAGCDPRTVARRVAGNPLGSLGLAERVDDALRSLGFSPPAPRQAEAPAAEAPPVSG
jgi:hypothetical protein